MAKVDPDAFGICITMADGTVYQSGNCDTEFTIQSMSKPFTYGQALQRHGFEEVLKRVGVEPTGEAFNSIILDEKNNRPFNPMVNAGAISVANLLLGPNSGSEMISLFSDLAGRSLNLNESIYQSELATGHRNRAIAYMMLNTGMIENDPEEVLRLYFQQCSINVNCRDMAIMAATLANKGMNPKTRKQVIEPQYVKSILTLMQTCGMYDYAGQWAFEVGIPAKSGVAGGVIAVIPGQAGISVWSPRLDSYGNSVRGISVCKELSDWFSLHEFAESSSVVNSIRRSCHLTQIRSKRLRSKSEEGFLAEKGGTTKVVELHGKLFFASAESAIRLLSGLNGDRSDLVIDFSRVFEIDRAATHLFVEALDSFVKEGRKIWISGMRAALSIGVALKEIGESSDQFVIFANLDSAIEAAEDAILEGHFEQYDTAVYAMSKFDLLRGMDANELGAIESVVELRRYDAGQTIVTEGEEPTSFFIVANGLADIVIELGDGRQKRLACLGPASSFGELALVEEGRRTASVIARAPTLCYIFPAEAIFNISQTHPGVLTKLLSNIVGQLSSRLKAANEEIRSME